MQSSLSTLHVPVVSDVSLVFGTVDYPFDSLLRSRRALKGHKESNFVFRGTGRNASSVQGRTPGRFKSHGLCVLLPAGGAIASPVDVKVVDVTPSGSPSSSSSRSEAEERALAQLEADKLATLR